MNQVELCNSLICGDYISWGGLIAGNTESVLNELKQAMDALRCIEKTKASKKMNSKVVLNQKNAKRNKMNSKVVQNQKTQNGRKCTLRFVNLCAHQPAPSISPTFY